MTVSLDLDDTLIPHHPDVPREPSAPPLLRLLLREPLRLGTRELLAGLQARGCGVWLYTTSLRRPSVLRLWFALLGCRLGGVVNHDRHCRDLRRDWAARFPDGLPSKYPPAYGIDLHVDDSAGVQAEGREHGFSVCRVDPLSATWVAEVLAAVDAAMAQQGLAGAE